ncbi:hypothetical protein [Lihuaxuella thermophila]|uniref:Uncharacterized protein n=1 Tax=Lihuaxuella thermophila TaxID=1173111 RepID=A0A1H8BF66_9BACL|nr:hypothetical protein [Lihuaxuella thermophila]SEM80774.1 hypothetical protein SAMN05444955_102125 [Lihuaxuella thermophila]
MSVKEDIIERLTTKWIQHYQRIAQETGQPIALSPQGWCDFCGEGVWRWQLHLVEQSDKAIGPAKSFLHPMACETCIHQLQLTRSEDEEALEFEALGQVAKRMMQK